MFGHMRRNPVVNANMTLSKDTVQEFCHRHYMRKAYTMPSHQELSRSAHRF